MINLEWESFCDDNEFRYISGGYYGRVKMVMPGQWQWSARYGDRARSGEKTTCQDAMTACEAAIAGIEALDDGVDSTRSFVCRELGVESVTDAEPWMRKTLSPGETTSSAPSGDSAESAHGKQPLPQPSEAVNPRHYRETVPGIECIDVLEALSKVWPQPIVPHLFSVGQYWWRCGSKGDPIEDLEKMAWYINRALGVLRLERK